MPRLNGTKDGIDDLAAGIITEVVCSSLDEFLVIAQMLTSEGGDAEPLFDDMALTASSLMADIIENKMGYSLNTKKRGN